MSWYAFSPRNRPHFSAGTPKTKSGCLPLGGTVGWGVPRPVSWAASHRVERAGRAGLRVGNRVGGGRPGGRGPVGARWAGLSTGRGACGAGLRAGAGPRIPPSVLGAAGSAAGRWRCGASQAAREHGGAVPQRVAALAPSLPPPPAPAEFLAAAVSGLGPHRVPVDHAFPPPPGSQPTWFSPFRGLRVWRLQGPGSDPSPTPGRGQRSPQHIPAWRGHLIGQL